MPKRCSTEKDAYWYRTFVGLHSQKCKNVAIKEFVSEWEKALKKYTKYYMNKVLIIMQLIKCGN
jgi:hypothetical protein